MAAPWAHDPTDDLVRSSLEHEGAVLRVVFGRGRGNVLDLATIDALRSTIRIEGRSGLRLVAFEGSGPDFSFGASVGEHFPERVEEMLPAFHRLLADVVHLELPTCALIRGRCLGGGLELASACDLLFVERSAFLAQPEVQLGVFAPAASVLLPVRIGHARAVELLLTGRPFSGEEAGELGLALVSDDGELEPRFDEWVSSFVLPRSAVALSAAARAARWPLREALDRRLRSTEALYLDEVARSADGIEGLRAFVDKRPPTWAHR